MGCSPHRKERMANFGLPSDDRPTSFANTSKIVRENRRGPINIRGLTMPKKSNIPADGAELRRRAETRLKGQHAHPAPSRTEADTNRLLHELQVHQVELEMQNAELQEAPDK